MIVGRFAGGGALTNAWIKSLKEMMQVSLIRFIDPAQAWGLPKTCDCINNKEFRHINCDHKNNEHN